MIEIVNALHQILAPRWPLWKPAAMQPKSGDAERSVEDLIALARNGDQGALTELFHLWRAKIGQWAEWELGKTRLGLYSASDIAQETAEHAFRSFSSFDGNTEGEWIAWLKSILRNGIAQTARNAHRLKRDERDTLRLDTSVAADLPAPGKSPSQELAYQEETHHLITEIYKLEDDWRDAIYLHRIKGLSVSEVALRMGKTPTKVPGLVARGVKALQKRMNHVPSEDTMDNPAVSIALREAEEAFGAYLQLRDSGCNVDQEAFLARHPHCAQELRPMLYWIERIDALRPGSLKSSPDQEDN